MKHRTTWLTAPVALALGVLPVQACGSADGPQDRTVAAEAATPGTRAVSEDVSSPQEGPGRGMAWVILGADTVVAEVASTADERRDGLMYREQLEPNAGMLFVFPDEDVRSFWMSNTFIPLDIAFIDSGNRIVDIQQMEPEDTDLTESRGRAMYALEVNQGWFEAQGVDVGAQAQIVFGPR